MDLRVEEELREHGLPHVIGPRYALVMTRKLARHQVASLRIADASTCESYPAGRKSTAIAECVCTSCILSINCFRSSR